LQDLTFKTKTLQQSKMVQQPIMPVWLPFMPKLRGRGMRGFEWNMYQEQYRFRKAPYAKNPFDIKMPKVKL